MGQWFARFLAGEGHDLLLVGRNEAKLREIKPRLGVGVTTNPGAVESADLVIISVPMDSFEEVVKHYSPYIPAGHAVIEVTSVKVAPLDAMHRHLKTQKVLGVHPMFGPGAKDLAGHNFVLTPSNEAENALAEKVKSYLAARGGKVSLMSPEQHDQTMAIVLGFPHLIALVAAETLLQLGDFEYFEKIGGTTCKLLLTYADSVLSEDPELYASLQMNLGGMGDIHARFRDNLTEWMELVANRDRGSFIAKMTAMAEQRGRADPNYKKAYQRMYRTLDS